MSNYDDYENNFMENYLKAMAIEFTIYFILLNVAIVFFYTHPLITDDIINYMIMVSHSIVGGANTMGSNIISNPTPILLIIIIIILSVICILIYKSTHKENNN
jgi:hypothetical protein